MKKIWILTELINDYNATETFLCWWSKKPTFAQLATIMGYSKTAPSALIGKMLNKGVSRDHCNTEFTLKKVEENTVEEENEE